MTRDKWLQKFWKCVVWLLRGGRSHNFHFHLMSHIDGTVNGFLCYLCLISIHTTLIDFFFLIEQTIFRCVTFEKGECRQQHCLSLMHFLKMILDEQSTFSSETPLNTSHFAAVAYSEYHLYVKKKKLNHHWTILCDKEDKISRHVLSGVGAAGVSFFWEAFILITNAWRVTYCAYCAELVCDPSDQSSGWLRSA